MVTVFEVFIYDVCIVKLAHLVGLHSNVESAHSIERLKHVRIAHLHLLANNDLQVADGLAHFHFYDDVFVWVCHQRGRQSDFGVAPHVFGQLYGLRKVDWIENGLHEFLFVVVAHWLVVRRLIQVVGVAALRKL